MTYTSLFASYFLGGLKIVISAEHSLHLNCSSSVEENFFLPRLYDTCLQVDFSISPHEQESKGKEVIFTQELASLYKTTRGYFQSFYRDVNTQERLWDVTIDPIFSQFHYVLYPGAEKIDLYALATRIFFLQHSFIHHQGLIFHASGGSFQGKGLVFAAPSGTGKSTLSRLLQPYLENQLFSEDRLIVRFLSGEWWIFGTPWYGSGDIVNNEKSSLAALVFLRQAQETAITRLHPAKALHSLLQVTSIPWYSEEWSHKGLTLCETLLQAVPLFELAFRPDHSAVQAVEQLLASLP
jgi:hypothetical protein